MSGKTSKRLPEIELCRVFACLLVIACHSCLPIMVDGGIDNSHVFLSALCADGVGLFWMISGCFFFTGGLRWKKRAGKAIPQQFAAIVFVTLLTFYLRPLLVHHAAWRESFSKSADEYKALFSSFLRWAPSGEVGHLWYLYISIAAILVLPVVFSFCENVVATPKYGHVFLCVTAVLLLWNDLMQNELLDFSHHTVTGLVPAYLFMITGGVLMASDFVRKIPAWILLLISVSMVFIRTAGYIYGFSNTVFWYSCGGYLFSCCWLSIFLKMHSFLQGKKVSRGILWLGSYTFPIYLFHVLVVQTLQGHGVYQYIEAGARKLLPDPLSEAFYLASVSLISFAITICFCIIGRSVLTGVRKAIKRG